MERRFVLGPEQAPGRVDRVLAALLPEVSRSAIQRWIADGNVDLDGRPCRASAEAGPGSVLVVRPGVEPLTHVQPDASVPFEVVHEDAHLLVVDKPAGVVVHPGKGNREGTLVAGLLARGGFESAPIDPRDREGHLRPGIVHRIDKQTSGLLVVAKDGPTREGLKRQLGEHSVERCYHALTLGIPRPGTIETLHGRHPKVRYRFTSHVPEGRRAVTHVSIVEELAGGAAALVACRLETGRTHQIRVHLLERAGTPILSDSIYGRAPADPFLSKVARGLGRQALHAAVLGFTHPTTEERMRFESPLPPEMASALAALRTVSRCRSDSGE